MTVILLLKYSVTTTTNTQQDRHDGDTIVEV